MVRFSPAELAALDEKVRAARETRSGLIRAAVEAYRPGANAIRETETGGGPRVVYDEEER